MKCRYKVLISDRSNIEENLALEEALVQQAEQGVLCLFFWRNEDCVVIGRNQDPEAECRMDAAENLGIRIARRSTGGGAVFQDMGNLNVSFIAPADSLNELICEGILLKALEKCGIGIKLEEPVFGDNLICKDEFIKKANKELFNNSNYPGEKLIKYYDELSHHYTDGKLDWVLVNDQYLFHNSFILFRVVGIFILFQTSILFMALRASSLRQSPPISVNLSKR